MDSAGTFAGRYRDGEVAMSPFVKRALLMGALLCMIVLTCLAPSGETDDVALSPRAQAKVASSPAAVPQPPSRPVGNASHAASPSIDVLGIVARDGDMPEDDPQGRLFEPVSWKAPIVEVSVAPVARPVEKPSAPPLPFTVLGRYDDKQRSVVFLQQGEQNLAVHVGDKIGANYKVESLNGTSMALRYLPTNQLQALEVGGAR